MRWLQVCFIEVPGNFLITPNEIEAFFRTSFYLISNQRDKNLWLSKTSSKPNEITHLTCDGATQSVALLHHFQYHWMVP